MRFYYHLRRLPPLRYFLPSLLIFRHADAFMPLICHACLPPIAAAPYVTLDYAMLAFDAYARRFSFDVLRRATAYQRRCQLFRCYALRSLYADFSMLLRCRMLIALSAACHTPLRHSRLIFLPFSRAYFAAGAMFSRRCCAMMFHTSYCYYAMLTLRDYFFFPLLVFAADYFRYCCS